ncbi:MAG: hypothetical protein JXB30_19070 [Anaerolineae bacterium]|nr:hypothetical protein [Anaerolineae bacterium]
MNRILHPRTSLSLLIAAGQLALLAGCDTADFDAVALQTQAGQSTHQKVIDEWMTAEETPDWLIKELSETQAASQDDTLEPTPERTLTQATSFPSPLPILKGTVLPTISTPTSALTPSPSPKATELSGNTPTTVISFEADVEPFSRVPPDSQVTLSWEIEGGGWVAICSRDHNSWELECQTDLPQSGTTRFVMPQAFWVEYQLQVSGLSAGMWPTLLVHATCTQDWFFSDPPPPFACPNQTVSYLNAVAQPFQGGMMIINQFGDISIFETEELLYRDIWGESGGIGDTSNLIPPDGLYLPDPVLAPAWLGEYQGTEDLRERLGWATEPAVPYLVTSQCEVNPPGPHIQPCYLLGPDDTIYQFTYDKIHTETGSPGYKEGEWQIYQPE